MTTTLRPWLALDGEAPRPFWCALLEAMQVERREGEEIALQMDDLESALEDACLETGARRARMPSGSARP